MITNAFDFKEINELTISKIDLSVFKFLFSRRNNTQNMEKILNNFFGTSLKNFKPKKLNKLILSLDNLSKITTIQTGTNLISLNNIS